MARLFDYLFLFSKCIHIYTDQVRGFVAYVLRSITGRSAFLLYNKFIQGTDDTFPITKRFIEHNCPGLTEMPDTYDDAVKCLTSLTLTDFRGLLPPLT